jgi:hypothetical protein
MIPRVIAYRLLTLILIAAATATWAAIVGRVVDAEARLHGSGLAGGTDVQAEGKWPGR